MLDKAEASNADIVVAPFQFCYLDGTSYKSSFFNFSSMSGIDYLKEILNNKKLYTSEETKYKKASACQGKK